MDTSTRHASQASRSRQARSRNLARHARKCSICNHANREAIEADFLHWRSPFSIVEDYRLPHHTAIYRHAAATGLDVQRRHGMRTALEAILEQASQVKPTGDDVVRAVCLYSQFDDSGRWTPSPKTHRHIHLYLCPECGSATEQSSRAPDSGAPPSISNSESGD